MDSCTQTQPPSRGPRTWAGEWSSTRRSSTVAATSTRPGARPAAVHPTGSAGVCADCTDADFDSRLRRACRLGILLLPRAQRAVARLSISDGCTVQVSASRGEAAGRDISELLVSTVAVSAPAHSQDRTPLGGSRLTLSDQLGAPSVLEVTVPVSAGARLRVSMTTPQRWAFDVHDEQVLQTAMEIVGQGCGDVLERRAAQALAWQMECKLASSAVVEQAKGVVMAIGACPASEAFAFLADLSQATNTKLRLVAQALVFDATTPAHAAAT